MAMKQWLDSDHESRLLKKSRYNGVDNSSRPSLAPTLLEDDDAWAFGDISVALIWQRLHAVA